MGEAANARRLCQCQAVVPTAAPRPLPHVPPILPCPADPSFHAISAACTSPNGKWWVGQSQDNQSECAAPQLAVDVPMHGLLAPAAS